MHLLEVHDLSVVLDQRRVVHDVSFSVDQGQSVAIIGPNGSGKTVLIKSLLGILPHDGEIRWRPGVRIGYVPQNADDADRPPLRRRSIVFCSHRVP
ncbi:MAG TPA: ATP-binding cassette domain-containing protein [Vicinamibacterales bacterium]|nr:ATP-binding cassette domain-containing protein [Vicinamibacterales bacterium]